MMLERARDEASTDPGFDHASGAAGKLSAEFKRRKAKRVVYTPKGKGDILIWHGRLFHRGTVARNQSLLRPGIIAHYSATDARPEFGTDIRQWRMSAEAGGGHGGYFWNNNADTADDDTDKWYFRNRKRVQM